MKISYKIFFISVVTVMLSFGVGGYLLIHSAFQSSLEREIEVSTHENAMLQTFHEIAFLTSKNPSGITDDTVAEVSASVQKGMGKNVELRICNAQRRQVCTSANEVDVIALIEDVSEGEQKYTIRQQGDSYLTQTSSLMRVKDKTWYLESFRDITYVFNERTEQFAFFQKIMLGMFLLIGASLFLLSRWITRPILKLTKAAEQIADGQIDMRVSVKSRDEVGELADHFNRMADEVEQKIHDLEDAARRQEDFVASFAHELKTPLTSMIGYSDMLRSKQMADEDRFLSANYIFSEGKRLENLSQKLLGLIVLEKNQSEMEPVPAKLLFDSMDSFAKNHRTLQEADFTAEYEDAVLLCDADLIKTLLFNLLDNAGKALQEGGRVSATGRSTEQGYLFQVADNGKGIPKEDLPKITEAFYMVDKSRARKNGGVGLGLSICQRIVKLHDAKIEFESEPEKGTTVSVWIQEAGKCGKDESNGHPS